jgi:hypothetical protein
MSEIQDAAQIIKVTFEGTEIILKVGRTGWDFVKEVCAVFKKLLEQEKLSGKASVKKLLKMGGDLQVFRFQTEDMKMVKKLADKYGILYAVLPDLNAADGMSEILFHSQAAPRIESIEQQIEHAKIESMEDYIANADPQEKEKLVEDAGKKPAMLEEKEYKLVVEEMAKKPETKLSDVRFRLNMTWMEIWPIIKHMEQNDLASLSKEGTVTMKMGVEESKELLDSEQWKQWFGKAQEQRRTGESPDSDEKMQEIRRIQKETKNGPNVNAITIDRKMVTEETEKHIKTRIPLKPNEFIWLDKSEITWINDHKTIFAGLEKEKQYAVLDQSNHPVRTVSGQKLYEQSYDEVKREQAFREREKLRKQKQRQHLQAQKALEEGRKALQGRRSR